MMRKNKSPWLEQLDHEREHTLLESDVTTDVAIIGAGIAGVATAFSILENTNKSVLLVERYKLAHGATGHNAGQLVGHFERGLKSLVDEFGLSLAIQGQRDIESGWDILEHIFKTAKLEMPFFSFMGHTGLSSREQVLLRLEHNRLRAQGGLDIETMEIAETADFSGTIPSHYEGLYSLVPLSRIQALLETPRTDFLAVLSYRKGCLNSALFCQEVIKYLLAQYSDRFTLYEHTPANKIALHDTHGIIDTGAHTITASRIILCTNGFENIRILNISGLDIDAKYHYLVTGKRGYMSGYLEESGKKPIAMSYFTDPGIDPDNSYFYLTRRPYEREKGHLHNLISIGGPDVSLEDTTPYSRDDEYPEEFAQEIDHFIRSTYDTDPHKDIDYIFTWHGLMGYTKNGVRMVGPEPQNPVLLYNLGCNGIGILPSLFGAAKITRHIRGEQVEKSIFDVPTSIPRESSRRSSRIARFVRWLRSD